MRGGRGSAVNGGNVFGTSFGTATLLQNFSSGTPSGGKQRSQPSKKLDTDPGHKKERGLSSP